MKGGSDSDSIVDFAYCKAGYWSINVGVVVICLIIDVLIVKNISLVYEKKKDVGMVQRKSKDYFVVTPDLATKLLICSFIAGILAAMVGIGGGLVVLPILLSTGLPSI